MKKTKISKRGPQYYNFMDQCTANYFAVQLKFGKEDIDIAEFINNISKTYGFILTAEVKQDFIKIIEALSKCVIEKEYSYDEYHDITNVHMDFKLPNSNVWLATMKSGFHFGEPSVYSRDFAFDNIAIFHDEILGGYNE